VKEFRGEGVQELTGSDRLGQLASGGTQAALGGSAALLTGGMGGRDSFEAGLGAMGGALGIGGEEEEEISALGGSGSDTIKDNLP